MGLEMSMIIFVPNLMFFEAPQNPEHAVGRLD